MALFDINKALEKAGQSLSNIDTEKLKEKANEGLSGAVQSLSSVAQSLGEASQEISESFNRGRDGDKKCPGCGHLINGISAVCPMCGYEFRDASNIESLKDLTREIDRLERRRNSLSESLAKRRQGYGAIHPTDEKICNLIRNFIVPNTKEDIFEFMLLASGNMDNKILAGKNTTNDIITEPVTKAWEAKFIQTYEKAKIAFGEDPDFSKIKSLYEKKMNEIAAEKATVNFFNKRR